MQYNPNISKYTISSKAIKIILSLLFIIAVFIYFSGIKEDLPYTPFIDEPVFVNPALHIAAYGNLNPHWFGNPGSTVIYPLAGIFHVWNSVKYGQSIFQANPEIIDHFEAESHLFYLLGRSLNISYALLTLGLVFLLGKKLFDERIGLLAGFFYVFNTLTLFHVQIIRTDIAAVFWGTLSLYFLLELVDKPTLLNHIFAGAVIGVSISTRYFMGVLILILICANTIQIIRKPETITRRKFYFYSFSGFLAIPLFFFITTPYFFPDFATALKDIQHEARSTHIGADGLSPLGNLIFYLTHTFPVSIAIPQEIFAFAGVFLLSQMKNQKYYLLPVYILSFILGISVQSLHWDRWVIPIFPILAVLSAYTIFYLFDWYRQKFGMKQNGCIPKTIFLLTIIITGSIPLYRVTIFTIQQLRQSTNVTAREWVYANIQNGSKIVAEGYTAPDLYDDYDVMEQFVAYNPKGAIDYADSGYEYLMVSSSIYNRFYAEPERYEAQIKFYDDLFFNYPLMYKIEPDVITRGPTIQIYSLRNGP